MKLSYLVNKNQKSYASLEKIFQRQFTGLYTGLYTPNSIQSLAYSFSGNGEWKMIQTQWRESSSWEMKNWIYTNMVMEMIHTWEDRPYKAH